MENMTVEEFEETLVEGWEIDFLIDGVEFYYRRYEKAEKYYIDLCTDGVILYERDTETMEGILEELMQVEIWNGKTLAEVEDDIVVLATT